MFEYDVQGSRKNQVEICDMETQVFKAMMNFIYTGKAPNLHSIADAGLVTTDNYDLEHFKVTCENVSL